MISSASHVISFSNDNINKRIILKQHSDPLSDFSNLTIKFMKRSVLSLFHFQRHLTLIAFITFASGWYKLKGPFVSASSMVFDHSIRSRSPPDGTILLNVQTQVNRTFFFKLYRRLTQLRQDSVRISWVFYNMI